MIWYRNGHWFAWLDTPTGRMRLGILQLARFCDQHPELSVEQERQ